MIVLAEALCAGKANPYLTPVIKHCDLHDERNGAIVKAQWVLRMSAVRESRSPFLSPCIFVLVLVTMITLWISPSGSDRVSGKRDCSLQSRPSY